MKKRLGPDSRSVGLEGPTAEILILADGTVYAHNITPQMARLLALLDPSDTAMRTRAAAGGNDPTPAIFPHPAP